MSKTERAVDKGVDAAGDDDAALDEHSTIDTPEYNGDEIGIDVEVDDDGPRIDEERSVAVDDEPYELPEIVPATPDDDADPADDSLTETEVVEPLVSTEVLEELRRADIDGPTVAVAPHDVSSGVGLPRRAADYDPAPFPVPVTFPRMLGRKPRVRRVTRVVRHVDPWSVFKIAIVANLVLYVIALTAGVLLWNVAYATGTVGNVERFLESFGWSSFEFNGGEIYHNAWIGGLFAVIGFTGLAVLLAALFNLITDLVGGIRFTVLEEEVVEARTSPMRRFVVRRAEPEVPVVTSDDSGRITREAIIDDSGNLPR
jgi:hypothetical protein